MIKTLPLLLFIAALNFSCNSVNRSLAQDINQNYSFFIDSTKSAACNICLVEDLKIEAQGNLLMKKASGEIYEVEQLIFDSLVQQQTKIMEVFETEWGSDLTVSELEEHSKNQCLASYSFPSLKEAETTELLINFDTYYWSLEIPKPYYSKFNIEDFDKDESGKYVYICKGNKTLMTRAELEQQFNKVISSYTSLNNYKDSMANKYYMDYTGKVFSEIDKAEQLMFLEHKNRTLFGIYKLDFEQFVKKKDAILGDDLKLQTLKKRYLDIIELKE